MPPLLIPHRIQLDDGYCLAACVEMVLAYQGVELSQADIARQLGVIPNVGAAAFNVLQMRSATLQVTYQQGELTDLADALEGGIPPILPVMTGELPYWSSNLPHAIVLAGVESETATVNDPAFPEPVQVNIGDLLLAWDGRGNSFALLKRL